MSEANLWYRQYVKARADLAAAHTREAALRALCDRCEQGRGPLAMVPISYVRRALDGTDQQPGDAT